MLVHNWTTKLYANSGSALWWGKWKRLRRMSPVSGSDDLRCSPFARQTGVLDFSCSSTFVVRRVDVLASVSWNMVDSSAKISFSLSISLYTLPTGYRQRRLYTLNIHRCSSYIGIYIHVYTYIHMWSFYSDHWHQQHIFFPSHRPHAAYFLFLGPTLCTAQIWLCHGNPSRSAVCLWNTQSHTPLKSSFFPTLTLAVNFNKSSSPRLHA